MTTEVTEVAPNEDLSFAAGFETDDAPGPQPAAEVVEEAKPEPIVDVVEAPFALSKEQFDQLQQQINGLSHVPEDVRKAHGNIGELKRTQQQLLEAIQKQGEQGKLTNVQFKRLSEEFPEMAKLLSEDLNELNAPVKPEPLGADQVKQFVESAIASVKAENTTVMQKQERKLLSFMHSDWEQVVTSTDFKQWIDVRPDREEFNNSWDSEYISKVLRSYKDAEKAKADAKATAVVTQSKTSANKKQRLEAAVTPTGVATTGAPQLSEQDLFRAGFSAG